MKALQCSDELLVRNTTSYVSLAAIHNGLALAQYCHQIIANILDGTSKTLSFALSFVFLCITVYLIIYTLVLDHVSKQF